LDRGNIFAKNHNNGSTSVLAVDDEYDIVNLIKQSLQVNGNKVCAYTDANIALYEISNNFSKIVENIQNVHTDNIDEVQNNISKGQLVVIDSNTIYKETTSGTYIVDFLLSKISRMKQKLQHVTKGAMIFNAPDPFFSHDKYDVFIDFEGKIDKALPDDIGLCWYKPKWLKKLSLAYTISILTHHKCTVDLMLIPL
jgi:CheY-like chemotaxis protein